MKDRKLLFFFVQKKKKKTRAFSLGWLTSPVHCSSLLCFVFLEQQSQYSKTTLHSPALKIMGRMQDWKIGESWKHLHRWNQRHFKASNRRGDSPSRAIWEQSVWIVEVLPSSKTEAAVPLFMSAALNMREGRGAKDGCTDTGGADGCRECWELRWTTPPPNQKKKKKTTAKINFCLHISFLTFKLTTKLLVDCLNDLRCCPCSRWRTENTALVNTYISTSCCSRNPSQSIKSQTAGRLHTAANKAVCCI